LTLPIKLDPAGDCSFSEAMSEALIAVLNWQAKGCRGMEAPFSAALLERAALALPASPALQVAFAPFAELGQRALFEQAVALRWLAALHDLALERPSGDLAAAYPGPGRPGDAGAAWPHVLHAMTTEAARFAAFMEHEPQTNEVRRSAVLLGGFLTIAQETGLPLRLIELGASAGLNQLWDQRRYRLGRTAAWGPADARLTLETDWRGSAPPLAAARVHSRAACDRKPIALSDPAQRRRLTAYVWADQADRLARLQAAIEETLAAGIGVQACDAVVFAKRRARPEPGVATVVFHSVFLQYMPVASQQALATILADAGAKAEPDAPFAWLRMEPAADSLASMELRLTLWPDGRERLLATAHPHGAWVEWIGA
jgi:hypothetical protein